MSHSINGYYDAEFSFYSLYDPSSNMSESTKKWRERNSVKDEHGNRYYFSLKLNLQVKSDRMAEFVNKKVFKYLGKETKKVEVHKDGKTTEEVRKVNYEKNNDYDYLIGLALTDAEFADKHGGSTFEMDNYTMGELYELIIITKAVPSVKYKEGRDDFRTEKDETGNEWEEQVDIDEIDALNSSHWIFLLCIGLNFLAFFFLVLNFFDYKKF